MGVTEDSMFLIGVKDTRCWSAVDEIQWFGEGAGGACCWMTSSA